MTDLDLRLVRYFTVVAAHRNVGRAAAELHIAQPSLSRQLTVLEQRIGARLLERSRQGTTLTAAGAAFLPHALDLLAASERGVADAVTAAGPPRLAVGYTTGLVVTPAIRLVRERHPDADVEMRHVDWDEPREALLDRRVDVLVTRLPLTGDSLLVTVLYEEPKVLLVGAGHRLADRETVELCDIRDEPIPRFDNPQFDDYWRIDPRPGGDPAPDGPVVHSMQDKVELIAAGEAVAIIPGAGFAVGARSDLRTIPLLDVDPGLVVVASRRDDHRPLVDTFRTAARQSLPPANHGRAVRPRHAGAG